MVLDMANKIDREKIDVTQMLCWEDQGEADCILMPVKQELCTWRIGGLENIQEMIPTLEVQNWGDRAKEVKERGYSGWLLWVSRVRILSRDVETRLDSGDKAAWVQILVLPLVGNTIFSHSDFSLPPFSSLENGSANRDFVWIEYV
jgi:hypothetical protein